jgi:hypothetical protein
MEPVSERTEIVGFVGDPGVMINIAPSGD